jgi:hypothetical protein
MNNKRLEANHQLCLPKFLSSITQAWFPSEYKLRSPLKAVACLLSSLSSIVTNLVLISESVTSSTSVVRWLTIHSSTFNSIQLFNCLLSSLEDESLLNQSKSQSQSYVKTDGQSASLSWNKAPNWGLRPEFYYCQTVAGLLMWGALSDERTDLSFTIAPGPCQCRQFRVRLPWDS